MIFCWGARPKTWQGEVYISAVIAIIVLAGLLSLPAATKAWALGILVAILVLVTRHIMVRLLKVSGERENCHQLLIERNCSFGAIATLLVAAAYQGMVERLDAERPPSTYRSTQASRRVALHGTRQGRQIGLPPCTGMRVPGERTMPVQLPERS